MNKKTGTIVLGASLAAVLVVSYVLYAGLTRNGKTASSLPRSLFLRPLWGTSHSSPRSESFPRRLPHRENPYPPHRRVPGKAPASSAAESVNPNDLAPDFTVYDASGKAVKLSDFRGTPVVINFWASWCKYCKEEMPDFNEVYKQYNGSVKFLFIDWVDGQAGNKGIGRGLPEAAGVLLPGVLRPEAGRRAGIRPFGHPRHVLCRPAGAPCRRQPRFNVEKPASAGHRKNQVITSALFARLCCRYTCRRKFPCPW